MIPSPVVVFGGTGFLGRYLVARLAETGARVEVATRDAEKVTALKPAGDVGQISAVPANLDDAASVARAVGEAASVVNLVGILYERGRNSFQAIHVDAAGHIAAAAAAAGAERLLHVSAIGADATSAAAYGRSKAAGEAAVRDAFAGATIFRPSIVFGPEDGFFNPFASLARFTPVLPLFGGGETRFQPVYVGDVARAAVAALADPSSAGQTYELGGPRAYTFAELLALVLKETGRRRLLVPVPDAIARFEAWFLEKLPKPLLTRDQLRMLADDNVVAADARTLADLGIEPTVLETVLPTYLGRYRRPGAPRVQA